ncbi:hypothetical protein BDA96_10G336700 [Sorghum bicolor]|uniref:Kri1-like C-terminal domain-containing protein n=2 Tax=Sorghum bicolor TaxID=4558 RepID=C5Z9F2_SORBI|nr:protein kri1 [Sorghum bicolor]EER90367.1 hypothetical protein SORBI_3010G261300 [Sorghum bicolor]KAG0516135.1 hypothetical protein BDA96_10G336700 [Sorghum bicolor]OQU77085.1 hypothetical protein SORBI_3010G261300 [Sorghum bicolor]|eukprot:XP_002439000.1 protein kri1 [Sorghum bicolor]
MGKGKKSKEKEMEKKPVDILAGSDEDSDGGEDLSKVQINEEYARRFEHNKRREALQRLEERRKQGLVPASDDGESDSESESTEEEDEEAAIASRLVDRRVFEVIRRIRSGDPRILDKDAKVYSESEEEEGGEEGEDAEKEEESKQGKKKTKKEKPLYLKDVNARHLLEEGPEFAAQASRSSSKFERIAYDEQQKKGLEAFLEAQKEVLGDDDDDNLFQVKPKVRAGADDEVEEDEEEKQTKELAGEVFGNDEELDENEKFLKEFFLKRPYLEAEKRKSYLDDIQELSDDEEELEIQEEYEHGYNYRHEEAMASGAVVADRVMGHSRVVEGSVRKKESSRKQQRKSKEERMARIKQQQAEELKHLKNLKKKEIAVKLERIRMIAGIEGDAACKLGADDLEEDFDPEDYDKKMQEMFDDSYYDADDVDPEFGSGVEMDLEKPDFDKEDELLGLPKGWASDQSKEESTAADAKGAKGKISLKDKVELEKEMEEYYKLDYEDTIGDIKTRFKYKQVKPNSFGLSACDILTSDDKDLNQYVSIKKLAPYREDEWKVTHHKMQSKDLILGGQKEGKKDKSVKKSRSEEGGPSSSKTEKDRLTNGQESTDDKKKTTRSERRKRRNADLKISDDRLAAFGKTNSKRHKSH